jgi:hypothetical protein
MSAYLDLQQIIATDPFVVHFVVRVVSIAATLVLDESESRAGEDARSIEVKLLLTICLRQSVELEYRSAQDGRSYAVLDGFRC